MSQVVFPQDPTVLGGCVSYAQIREDLVIQAFFPDVKEGFYVDVGAFDPDIDSVTKLFYLKGWHGVNIEPQTEQLARLQKARPRDINLHVGVSNETTELTLRSYKSQGLATFSTDVKREYEKAPTADTKNYEETVVPVRPLREILAEQKVQHIHFMKVDVESFEYEVLSSNDWSRFRPEVLCIEANHVKEDWRPLLRKADYELVFDDGLNEYYADSRTDRKRKFNYIQEVVIDRGGGIRSDHYDILLAWRDFGTDKAYHVEALAAENTRLQQRIHKTEKALSDLRVDYNSIKGTSKRLMTLLKHRANPKRS